MPSLGSNKLGDGSSCRSRVEARFVESCGEQPRLLGLPLASLPVPPSTVDDASLGGGMGSISANDWVPVQDGSKNGGFMVASSTAIVAMMVTHAVLVTMSGIPSSAVLKGREVGAQGVCRIAPSILLGGLAGHTCIETSFPVTGLSIGECGEAAKG